MIGFILTHKPLTFVLGLWAVLGSLMFYLSSGSKSGDAKIRTAVNSGNAADNKREK